MSLVPLAVQVTAASQSMEPHFMVTSAPTRSYWMWLSVGRNRRKGEKQVSSEPLSTVLGNKILPFHLGSKEKDWGVDWHSVSGQGSPSSAPVPCHDLF